MTFIFRNRTIFWDISKWNRGQKKWDGGSSILSIKTIPSMNAAMKFLWNDKQPLIFLPNLNIDLFIKKIRFELNPPMLLYPRVYMGTTCAFKKLNK